MEVAQERLKPFLVSQDDESGDDENKTRFADRIRKLPKKLSGIAFGLLSLDAEGKPAPAANSRTLHYNADSNKLLQDGFAAYEKLSNKERSSLLKTFFPQMADAVDRTWELLKSAPYQFGYERKAYRAPHHPEATAERRQLWLQAMLRMAEQYRDEALEPTWLVTWAPYLTKGYYGHAGDIGLLAAAILNGGGRLGDELFEILRQSAQNEQEIGGMGTHVVRALLVASREDGWELMEKMLLAAQRQEGLRQSILEAVDLAHPRAFRRMLKVIVDQNLVRFSAVLQAMDVWLGFGWDAESPGVINRTLTRVIELLEDEAARKKALAGTDAEAVYLSLWAMATEDAMASIPVAEKLLKHKSPEVRYAAVTHLRNLGLVGANLAAWKASDDDDLRVAVRATGFGSYVGYRAPGAEDDPLAGSDAFERLERLIERSPAKPQELEPIVWPWTKVKVSRESFAPALLDMLGKRPPTRLLRYLPDFDSWRRRSIIELFAQQKTWDAPTRKAIVELCGDSSSDVRAAALAALRPADLSDDEILRLEGMLTRKAGDLRSGVIGLFLKRSDAEALESADRLTVSKDANQRLAGLETLRQLVEQGREVEACRERAESFAERRAKLSADEKLQTDVIAKTRSASEVLTLENGLGLMDPKKRTPVVAPKVRKVKLITPAAVACLKELDALVHKHRETPVVLNPHNNYTELLGAIRYAFPYPHLTKSPGSQRERLPLLEVWEEWFANRPKKSRDPDGLELLRAARWWASTKDWGFKTFKDWVKGNRRRAPMIAPLESETPIELKYPGIVTELVTWLLFLHAPAKATEFVLDCAETLCAVVPQEELEALRPKPQASGGPAAERYGFDFDGDWRGHQGVLWRWLDAGVPDEKLTDDLVQRIWQLQHWRDEPIPGAERHRADASILFKAYGLGLANLNDIADQLVGPDEDDENGRSDFSSLSSLTKRRLPAFEQRLLNENPPIAELVNRIRSVVLESELERGDIPTAATVPAHAIESFYGIDTLVRLMTALGKNGFKPHTGWRAETKYQRLPTLTHLASVTYPATDETVEQFAARMKKEVKAGSFPEDRLIELAFLAPQWTKFVEAYFQWDGLAEGLYWFLAHMRFMWGSDIGAQAAESAGVAEEPETPADADDDDVTDATAPPQKKLSSWERLILERTALSDLDRASGAIDVGWFQKVYAALGPKRWERLAQSARFASNAAQAKKAQLIADVLLGKAKLNELIVGIQKRFLKDFVRLIGLYPLPTGTKRDAELTRRFGVLQEYGRYAKTLSGLTKPEAMRSLDIGLKNLASTAGYADALRLDWAMGAGEWSDLHGKSVAESKEGVTVTLSINAAVQPVIVVSKGDKELKSAPPAVKKHPPIAMLFERSKELKRQSSRQKQALEAAMCRGDEFSAGELVELSRHALVAPLLEKLLLITADGAIGYPDRKGAALRDHAGKSKAIGKSARLRIAHPHDLLQSGTWAEQQHEAFTAGRVQPFKQIFRELYVVTKAEKTSGDRSERYAGQQIQPTQATALWGSRGWNTQDGVFKVSYQDEIVTTVNFKWGAFTPLEVEGLTLDSITFTKRHDHRDLKLVDVPPRLFSETMRDIDLVVSVAHAGGVDPEASASTVEMRAALVRETCELLGLKNVRLKASHVIIDGELANYTVHLGSGTVHRMPGGSLCVVPVHAQQRGRLFLPFADDDPRTAEVISKVLLFARDREILDPAILEQIRM
jgi:hypothetical protein